MELTEKRYLGCVCPKGHEWKNTGKGLRTKRDYKCVRCAVIRDKGRRARRRREGNYLSGKGKRETCLAEKKRWYNRNRKKVLLYHQGNRSGLSDTYVKCMMRDLANEDIPDGLVQAKREVLKLHRLIRKLGG